jgi:hypothetical protein
MEATFKKRDEHLQNDLAEAWLTPGRFTLLLVSLVFVTYPEVILGEGTFFYRDFQLFAYPWAHYNRESFWRGEFPLWNPLSNCGVPFLAQWNTMTLYPGSLLYLLLPLSWSLGVFCLLHLVLGGFGMYRLAFRWSNHRWAAALAGVAFAFNGLVLNSLMWTNNIAALGWMPWVVLCVERAWREGGKRLVIAAIVGALQMLTGAPEIIFLTWVTAATIWLADTIEDRRSAGRTFRRLGTVAMLVAALAAVQLLPFLISSGIHSAISNSVAPFGRCPPGARQPSGPAVLQFSLVAKRLFQYDQYWTSSYYVAVGVLTLAVIAIWKAGQPRVRLLGLLLALSIVLAMGEHTMLYGWLKQGIPALGFMRYPIKFVVLALFILPVLAAFAASWFSSVSMQSSRTERRPYLIVICLALGLIAFILWYARFHPLYGPRHNHWAATWQSGWTRALILIVFAGGILTLPKLRLPRSRLMMQLGLVLLVWLDVLTHAPRQNPTIPRSAYQPVAELQPWKAALRETESRAMPTLAAESEMHQSQLPDAVDDFQRKRFALYSNCNLLDGVPKVNGVFSLHLREAEEIARLLYAPNRRPASRLVDFLNVSHLTLPGKGTPWHARTNFMSFVSAGQQPVFASAEECLRALQDPAFDPCTTVYVPIEARALVRSTNQGTLTVRHQRRTPHRIDLDTSGQGMVVLSQSYYHPWKAYVDGQRVPVLERIMPSRQWKFRMASIASRWSIKIAHSTSAQSFLDWRFWRAVPRRFRGRKDQTEGRTR